MVPRVVLQRLETTALGTLRHSGTVPTQRGTNGRERETGNIETTGTTSTQEGTTAREANTVTPKQPTVHRVTRGTKGSWSLEPKRKILIVGDSNLAKIPTFTQEDLQIESYPGMKFHHTADVLERTPRNQQVSHCIISVGINDRNRRGIDHTKKALSKTVKEAKRAFPCASIFVPLINYSTGLPTTEKQQLDKINREIQKKTHIPKLDQREFKTGQDNVHWLPETASAILAHWLCSLN